MKTSVVSQEIWNSICETSRIEINENELRIVGFEAKLHELIPRFYDF